MLLRSLLLTFNNQHFAFQIIPAFSISPASKMNRLVLLILSSLSLNAHAFGTVGSRVAQTPFSNTRSARSPLFVASAELTNGESTPSYVKNIDAKMAKAEKQRQRFEAKLSEFNVKLAELENQKKQYLEGSSLGKVEQNFIETTARSAVKAMMWRVVAGSVTFMTTLKFSGSVNYALKIVGSDFFSKALTMFIGERLMNKSSAGRKGGADAVGRSVVKALVWRLFAICNTLAVCFFVSKDFSMASKIAGSDAIFKTFLMISYERVWAKVEWGKEYQIDFAI
jgi:uncharacterized membrane protein